MLGAAVETWVVWEDAGDKASNCGDNKMWDLDSPASYVYVYKETGKPENPGPR